MAKNETRRNSPKVLIEDRQSHDAIKAMTTYEPSNGAYDAATLQTRRDEMEQAQAVETQKEADWKAARDAANAREWDFHNVILGAKQQVVAQYGNNSDEAQAVGLKKKSEYKSPHHNSQPAPVH